MKRILLIGFMGSGKTSLGKLLAEKFKYDFLEQDQEVLKLSEFKSINEIFEQKGEDFFREIEHQSLKNSVARDKVVISTGGGVIKLEKNVEVLKQTGNIVIYLKTEFSEIEKRLNGVEDRPLFKDKNKALELFKAREPIYLEIADFVINTDGKTLDEIVNEIEDIL